MSPALRRLVLFIVLTIFACLVVVVVFFLQENAQWVVIRFPTLQLSWEDPFPIVEYEARLWLVMLAFGLAGVALTFLLLLPTFLRRAVQRSRERRFINDLEGELADLRNLPVNEPAPLEDIEEQPRPASDADREREEEEEAALLADALQREGQDDQEEHGA